MLPKDDATAKHAEYRIDEPHIKTLPANALAIDYQVQVGIGINKFKVLYGSLVIDRYF